ncbi:hypothetical protein [Pengzhenrongella phosphoraccumulans]|uniref:hypothetical protein n=1 Tax=Pengzhenrongella phosphoraccumulans TaxID=3114394 RepID=UPI00388D2542
MRRCAHTGCAGGCRRSRPLPSTGPRAAWRAASTAWVRRRLDVDDRDPGQRDALTHYFTDSVEPILTPLAADGAHPFPFISSLGLNLASRTTAQPGTCSQTGTTGSANLHPARRGVEHETPSSKRPRRTSWVPCAGSAAALHRFPHRHRRAGLSAGR